MREIENQLKPQTMRISKHFMDRLKERTMYTDTETFLTDIQNKMSSVLKLNRYSTELNYYPTLRNKFQYYPYSEIFVFDWMGIGIVIDNNTLITVLKIDNQY